MAQIRLEANRAYPSIPTVGDTLESHRLALEAIVECIATHERRSKNVLDSFVRVGELQEMGLLELEDTASTGSGSSYIVDDDPSEESTSHHHDGTYLRIDGDNSMLANTGISWIDSTATAINFLQLTSGTGPVTVEHVYASVDTTPTPSTVSDDTAFQDLHTVLASGALTTGDTYLLVGEAMFGAASGANFNDPTDNVVKWTYNGADLASVATTTRQQDITGESGEPIGFAKIVTGAASDVKLVGKTAPSPDNSIKSSIARLMAINLTDLTASNYIAETTVASSVGVAGAEDAYASVGTYTIGDGTSDYVLFCNFKAVMTDDTASNVPDFEAWLRVDGGPFTNSDILKCGGSEKTHDGESFSRLFCLGIPAAASATLDFECAWHSDSGFVIPTDGTVSVTITVIALRLNDFDDYILTTSADLTDPGSAGPKERLNTTDTNAAATGNWHFFSGFSTYFPTSGNGPEAELRLELNAGGDVAVAGSLSSPALSHDPSSGDNGTWMSAFPPAAVNVGSGDSMELGLFIDPAPSAAAEIWYAGFLVGWSHTAVVGNQTFFVGDAVAQTQIDGAGAVVTTTLNVNDATDLDSTLNVDGATTLQSTLQTIGVADFDTHVDINGGTLTIYDGTGADSLAVSHDGTDAKIVMTQTSALRLENTAGAAGGIFEVVNPGQVNEVIQLISGSSATGAGQVDLHYGTDVEWYNSDNLNSVRMWNTGTSFETIFSTTVHWDVQNLQEFQLKDGAKLILYDGTDVDTMELYHDGTNAIVDAAVGGILHLSVAGIDRGHITSSGIESAHSGGARIPDASGSASNPTVEPNKVDPNTGIYGSNDILYLIAGQVSGLTLRETSNETRVFWDMEGPLTASITQTQAGAQLTDNSVAHYGTVANQDDAAVIGSANQFSGKSAFQVVVNTGANRLQLFPASGNNFQGKATNESIFIDPGEMRVFYGVNSGTYFEAAVPQYGLTLTDVLLDNTTGTPDYTTALDYINVTGQVGTSTGGVVTDNGDGTVAVTEWHGWLRSGGATSDLYSAKVAANSSLAVTDGVVSYIYAEYNGGTPQFAAYTAWQTDRYGKVWIASVHRTGTTVHVTTSPSLVPNFTNLWTDREATVYGIVRETGGITSESGTRNIAITAGEWWLGVNEFSTTAKDTAVADTFSYYYRDGLGGYTEVATQTQIDNTQYDDGSGTLATLTNNRYGVHWVYTAMDDDVYVVYGRGDYTLVQAEAATPPSDVPDHVVPVHGLLIAKIIIRKSASTFTSVQNPFSQVFTMSGAVDHGELAGLTDDDHTQYLLADGSRTANPIFKVADGLVASWTTQGLHLDESNYGGFLGDDWGIYVFGGGRDIAYWDDTGLVGKHVSPTPYIIMDVAASATQPVYSFSTRQNQGIGSASDDAMSLIAGDLSSVEMMRLDGTNTLIEVRGGNNFRINDSTDTDYVTLSHDGTDLQITGTNTTYLDITGANIWMDHTTPVIKMYENDQIADEKLWDIQTSGKQFRVRTRTDADAAGETTMAFIRGTGTDVTDIQWESSNSFNVLSGGLSKLRVDHASSLVRIRDGYALRIEDSTDTDRLTFSHDGTDFNIAGTGTTDLNWTGISIQKMASDLYVHAGGKLRVYDAGDTDYIQLSHDGTDFNTTFTTTADWNIDTAGALTGAIKIGADTHLTANSILRIRGNTSAKYVDISHDDTDLNIAGDGSVTADVNFTNVDVTVNSNYVLEGYGTQRNVLRTERVRIQPGATPGTNINCTNAFSKFNYQSLTNATNLAKSGTSGGYSLSADGRTLTLEHGNVINAGLAVIVIHDINSSSTTEMYTAYAGTAGSDVTINFFKRGSSSTVDITTIMDAGDLVDIEFIYFTNS